MAEKETILDAGKTFYRLQSKWWFTEIKTKKLNNYKKGKWRDLQPHLGTQIHYYRCSLPGLAEFIAYCCEGTGGHHNAVNVKI